MKATAPGTEAYGSPFDPTRPPDAGMMPFDEAVIAAGEMRRRFAANARGSSSHAIVHRGQRALPPASARVIDPEEPGALDQAPDVDTASDDILEGVLDAAD